MNTMQSFYVSLSSAEKPQETYLKILADLTKLSREQMSALKSDRAWQDWGEQQTAQSPA